MPWWSAEGEPELYFISKAKTHAETLVDIAEVFKRMDKNRAVDHAEEAKAMLWITNGTNSRAYVYWYNPEKEEAIGEWRYTITLDGLAEGKYADEFEEAFYAAVMDFTQNTLAKTITPFFRFELGTLHEME